MKSSDFALLFRHRDRVNPPHCDDLDKLRIRKDDPNLQHISFLYSCYSPSAYGFEIFDSYRRIIMQGLLTFAGIAGWETVRVFLCCLSIRAVERHRCAGPGGRGNHPCDPVKRRLPRDGAIRESLHVCPRQHRTNAVARHMCVVVSLWGIRRALTPALITTFARRSRCLYAPD